DRGVSPAIKHQIPGKHPGLVRLRLAIHRGSYPVIRAEPVERERHRVKLRVGSRAEKFLRIVLEKSFAGIERNDLDAPHGACKPRLSHLRVELLLKFSQCLRWLSLLGARCQNQKKSRAEFEPKNSSISFHDLLFCWFEARIMLQESVSIASSDSS